MVLSSAPDAVAVTLYRDPDRGDGEIDKNNPGSFALIAETRTVTLPPGEVTVRFEGVASGIVPQSAILFGTDPRERNRDAALLSQRGLVDSFTGQRVILRRTDPATGETVEEPATIRSAADRLVVTTPRGVEGLYCSGLMQTLIYPGVPDTLSAKPVLSMTTKDQPGGTVTITLAYLATGFDWDATYVGTLGPDGRSLNLLGWLTMASADDTSFIEATTAAVAGRINRSDATDNDDSWEPRLNRQFACWPQGTTSQIPTIRSLPPSPPPMMMKMDLAEQDIVVTGARRNEMMLSAPMAAAVVAKAENLGDLKLYRIPVPVTVAARSQKQVAFLLKDRIEGELLYRTRIEYDEPDDELRMLFRFQNRKKDGAGDPLPAGNWVLYQDSAVGRMYVGEVALPDKAAEEETEVAFARASNVTIDTDEKRDPRGRGSTFTVKVSNANPFPVRFEVDFPKGLGRQFSQISGKIVDKPGKRVWTATIPANNSVKLIYRAADAD